MDRFSAIRCDEIVCCFRDTAIDDPPTSDEVQCCVCCYPCVCVTTLLTCVPACLMVCGLTAAVSCGCVNRETLNKWTENKKETSKMIRAQLRAPQVQVVKT